MKAIIAATYVQPTAYGSLTKLFGLNNATILQLIAEYNNGGFLSYLCRITNNITY